MATKTPLVLGADGRQQQLQAADTTLGVGAFAPGSFTLAAGQYVVMSTRLTLTGSQRMTLAADACLRIV